jgi:hypothetical protein
MAAASASGGSTTSASKFADDFLFLLDKIHTEFDEGKLQGARLDECMLAFRHIQALLDAGPAEFRTWAHSAKCPPSQTPQVLKRIEAAEKVAKQKFKKGTDPFEFNKTFRKALQDQEQPDSNYKGKLVNVPPPSHLQVFQFFRREPWKQFEPLNSLLLRAHMLWNVFNPKPFDADAHLAKLRRQGLWLTYFGDQVKLHWRKQGRASLYDPSELRVTPVGFTKPVLKKNTFEDMFEKRESKLVPGTVGVFAKQDIPLAKGADAWKNTLPFSGYVMSDDAGQEFAKWVHCPTGMSMQEVWPIEGQTEESMKKLEFIASPVCLAAVVNGISPDLTKLGKQPNCVYSTLWPSDDDGDGITVVPEKIFEDNAVFTDPVHGNTRYTNYALHVRMLRAIRKDEELLVDYGDKTGKLVEYEPHCQSCQLKVNSRTKLESMPRMFKLDVEKEDEKGEEPTLKDLEAHFKVNFCDFPPCLAYIHSGCFAAENPGLEVGEVWFCDRHCGNRVDRSKTAAKPVRVVDEGPKRHPLLDKKSLEHLQQLRAFAPSPKLEIRIDAVRSAAALDKPIQFGLFVKDVASAAAAAAAPVVFRKGDLVTMYGGMLVDATDVPPDLRSHARRVPSTGWVLDGLPFAWMLKRPVPGTKERFAELLVAGIGPLLPSEPFFTAEEVRRFLATPLGFMSNTARRELCNVRIREVRVGSDISFEVPALFANRDILAGEEILSRYNTPEGRELASSPSSSSEAEDAPMEDTAEEGRPESPEY